MQGLVVHALPDCFMSPRTAGPALLCLHSPYSSAPIAHAGCTAPASTAGAAASPHCAANAATLMQSKEYICTRREGRASVPVPAPRRAALRCTCRAHQGTKLGARRWRMFYPLIFRHSRIGAISLLQGAGVLSESHRRLVKRMHSAIGAALADGEWGEERPLALLRPCVVKQRNNNFLYALSHSHIM